MQHIAEPLRPLAVPMADLNPDAANARTHDQRNIDAIARSLARWGQRQPIVVQKDGMIIRAGNGRYEAAKSLGWSHMAALIVDENSADATAYAIADNRTAELAEWDDESLAGLLQSLDAEDMADAGFTDDDLAEILASLEPEPEIVEDEPPEPPADPVTRTGDLWTLGRHRVVCGDATDADTVARVLDSKKPNLCVTDPPYGVNYDPEWRNEAAAKGQLAYAAIRVGKLENDDRADWSEVYKIVQADVVYAWSPPGDLSIQAGLAIIESGYQIRNQIVWCKPHFPISRGHYTYQHEPCWYAVRKGATSHWIGDASASTRWDISLDKNVEGGHSTQKPVECMARPIRNHEGNVIDPFLGSGTTLIAAEQLGRTCYGIEISPAYCDVIVRRWQNLTGETATRVDAENNPQPGLPDLGVPDG